MLPQSSERAPEPGLRRYLTASYLAIVGVGTMIGTGWLVQVANWWSSSGRVGPAIGFLCGGMSLLPVSTVYARLSTDMPSSGAELVFARPLSTTLSFFGGWAVILAYAVVCPWEAIQLGRIASGLWHPLGASLYRIGQADVTIGHLCIGMPATLALFFVHLRGIATVASMQRLAVGLLLLTTAITVGIALQTGSTESLLHPAFGASGGASSIFGMTLVVPFFLAGFESPVRCADERGHKTPAAHLGLATYWALALGTGIYVVLLLSVGALGALWDQQGFPTARVLAIASGKTWMEQAVTIVAMASLFKCFNGSLLAASRTAWAMSLDGLLPPSIGKLDARQVPRRVLSLLCLTTVGLTALGNGVLGPLVELGSLGFLMSWAIASLAGIKKFGGTLNAVSWVSLVVCLILIGGLVHEWLSHAGAIPIWVAFAAWLLAGMAFLLARS